MEELLKKVKSLDTTEYKKQQAKDWLTSRRDTVDHQPRKKRRFNQYASAVDSILASDASVVATASTSQHSAYVVSEPTGKQPTT